MVRSLLLMIMGEALIIFLENFAAKNANSVRSLWTWLMLVFGAMLSGVCLLLAYKFGYQYFENIWIVVAISIGTIVIVEPIISRYMFQQIPGPGALVGIVLGLAGIIVATMWR